MKNCNLILFTLFALISASCGKTPATIVVTGLSLFPESLELVEGETAKLNAEVIPANAANQQITWESSDPSVVYVYEGDILALSVGSADITVVTDDGGFKAVCKVTVKKKAIHVTGIVVSPKEITLMEGESTTLSASVSPVNADDKSFTWSSSDIHVVTVSNDGKITAVKKGNATITATTVDGGKSASCDVTVDIIRPVSVTLNESEKTLAKGQEFQLVATVKPAEAVDLGLTWASSDSAIVSVDDSGKVKALSIGIATITVSTVDSGRTATCKFTVESVKPESIVLNFSEYPLSVNDTLILVATVLPEDAEDKTVIWTSSDESFATVVNGMVTALKEGEVIITAQTVVGALKAECKIIIKDDGKVNAGNHDGLKEDDFTW